jgi:predicted nucleotidyltransferase
MKKSRTPALTTELDAAAYGAIRLFLERVSEKYEVTSAKLFGSRAREDARADSDFDIAVFLKGRLGEFVKTKLDMTDIAYDALLEEGIHIQALPVWEDELLHPEDYSNPYLLENIEREGIPL